MQTKNVPIDDNGAFLDQTMSVSVLVPKVVRCEVGQLSTVRMTRRHATNENTKSWTMSSVAS